MNGSFCSNPGYARTGAEVKYGEFQQNRDSFQLCVLNVHAVKRIAWIYNIPDHEGLCSATLLHKLEYDKHLQ